MIALTIFANILNILFAVGGALTVGGAYFGARSGDMRFDKYERAVIYGVAVFTVLSIFNIFI